MERVNPGTPNSLDAVEVTEAVDSDAGGLAELAAMTFPLACPPPSPRDEIAAFITANLSPERFVDYLAVWFRRHQR